MPDHADRWIELSALGVYLVVLLGIGIRSAMQVKTSVDFTLAGREIPWVIVMATTAATMIGGGASVGMVAEVARVGIAAALITSAWHLQLIFTGLWVAPRLRNLKLVTVGDYFEFRFGALARELAVVNCIIFLVGALAAQMAAVGTVTNALFEEISYESALLIGAAVVVFYSTVGGMRAVIKTDVLQFAILAAGIGTAAAVLFGRNGGFVGLMEKVGEASFRLTNEWSTLYVVSTFAAFLLGETFVPVYTVRCFVAKDARQARWGVAGGGLFLLLFLPIATFVLGASALADPAVKAQILPYLNREPGAPANVFPVLVRTMFHPVFSGVMIAALLAAIMSSADSCLSCLATVVMEDNYRRHFNPHAEDRQLLRVAKLTTLLAGSGAAVCALFFQNIASILGFIYDFWAPTMVLPFLVGVFWYRQTRVYAAVCSMIAGFAATILWRFVMWELIAFQNLAGRLQLAYLQDLSPALFGFAVAVIVFFVALPLTHRLPLGDLFQPQSLPQIETDKP